MKLYAQWKSLALSSDQHLLAVYGQTNSWTLGYNLFADVWLGTNLVESSVGVLECQLTVSDQFQVYDGHSNFIFNILMNSDLGSFGLPVDNAVPTDTNVTVSSWYFYNSEILLPDLVIGWSLYVAAMTSNPGLRSQLILRVYNRVTSSIPGVFPVYYDSGNGTSLQGIAR